MLAVQNGKLVRPIPSGFFDKFKLCHLINLEKVLKIIHVDNLDLIDIVNLKLAIKIVLKEDIPSEEIELLHQKIDVYSTGIISWSDVLTYFLQLCNERQEQEKKVNFRPFTKLSGKFPNLDHHDSTVAMKITPNFDGSMDMCNGNYISISQNGYIMTWNPDLEIVSKKVVEKHPSKDQPILAVIDMTCLGNADMIAVSTSCRDIRFYNGCQSDFQLEFSFVEFSTCVLALDYHVQPLETSSDSLLLCGDDNGGIHLIWMSPIFFSKLLMSVALKRKLAKIQYSHMCKKLITGLRIFNLHDAHSEAVLKIAYVPSISCFISCSPSTKEALVTYDLIKQSKTTFRSKRGVISFDFCQSKDWIITGCMDNSIKIWNRLVTTKPTKYLHGHISPVEFIIVDGPRMIMMSFCRLKYLKVWNFSRGVCLQTINCNNVGLGLHPVTCIFYNAMKRIMLLHTHQLIIFKAIEDDISENFVHRKPVTDILYSDKFNVVVTGDVGCFVAVWNMKTGQQNYSFQIVEYNIKDDFKAPIEMTAMAFDHSQRRLATADSTGTVKIWNYNVGMKLKTFQVDDTEFISSIGVLSNFFYFAGSRVNLLHDDGKVTYQEPWKKEHKMKIAAIAVYRNTTIATASVDGDIIIWIKELGIPLFRLSDNGSNHNGYSTLYLKNIDESKKKARKELFLQKAIEMARAGQVPEKRSQLTISEYIQDLISSEYSGIMQKNLQRALANLWIEIEELQKEPQKKEPESEDEEFDVTINDLDFDSPESEILDIISDLRLDGIADEDSLKLFEEKLREIAYKYLKKKEEEEEKQRAMKEEEERQRAIKEEEERQQAIKEEEEKQRAIKEEEKQRAMKEEKGEDEEQKGEKEVKGEEEREEKEEAKGEGKGEEAKGEGKGEEGKGEEGKGEEAKAEEKEETTNKFSKLFDVFDLLCSVDFIRHLKSYREFERSFEEVSTDQNIYSIEEFGYGRLPKEGEEEEEEDEEEKQRRLEESLYRKEIDKEVTLRFPYPKEVDKVIKEDDAMISCNKLLFLQSRENRCDVGTLLSCGMDGKIRFWSVKPGSGLLGRFVAKTSNFIGITAMGTDLENRYLATGHSNGILQLWLIEGYCNEGETVPEDAIAENMKRFPFLRLQKVFENKGLKEKQYKPEPLHPRLVVVHAPLLLNSYRAHMDAIIHIKFSNEGLLITGCWDGSVRVWRVDGSFIGNFGQSNLWNFQEEVILTPSCVRNMPSDIRKFGSPMTLKILNKGECPLWERGLKALRRCQRKCGKSIPWEKEEEETTPQSSKTAEEEAPVLGRCHSIDEKPVPSFKIPPLDDVNFKVSVYNILTIPNIEPLSPVSVTEEMAKSLVRAGYVHKAKKSKPKKT